MGIEVLGGVVGTGSSVWMHISLTSGLGCSIYLMTSTSMILTSSPKAVEIPLSSY